MSIASLDTIARNDRETWDALRRELEDIGISLSVITEKKQYIIAWFQEAVATGQLEEDTRLDNNYSARSSNETSNLGGDVDQAPPSDYEQLRTRVDAGLVADKSSKLGARASSKRSRQTTTLSSASQPPESRAVLASSLKGGKGRTIVTSKVSMLKGQDNESVTNKTNTEGFMQDVIWGHFMGASKFLDLGGNINILVNKWTALHRAVEKNDIRMACFLLEKGANPNSTANGRVAIPQLDGQERIGMTPLHYAAIKGHTQMVRSLLTFGASLQATLQVEDHDWLGWHGNYRVYHREDALILAVKASHKDTVRLLLEKGAFIESTGIFDRTPLLYAIWNLPPNFQILIPKYSIVQLLLDKGADTNAKDKHGHTPLFYAACSVAQEDLIELLMKHGADPAAKTGRNSWGTDKEVGDCELTIIEWAKKYSRESVYKSLTERKTPSNF
ncbi:MAG: hypothetical protein Q9170_002573 [Blastenia crenularia]